jgi:two-component system alkaline phosphatase synthesis response regulator PhoP
VEDEEDLRDILCSALEAEGFTAIGIRAPGLAPALAEAKRPDLFLIDIMLPTTNGIELAQQLRQQGFPRTPMIAMSASGAMLRFADQAGCFQAVLAKPFGVDVLLDEIHRSLETRSHHAG